MWTIWLMITPQIVAFVLVILNCLLKNQLTLLIVTCWVNIIIWDESWQTQLYCEQCQCHHWTLNNLLIYVKLNNQCGFGRCTLLLVSCTDIDVTAHFMLLLQLLGNDLFYSENKLWFRSLKFKRKKTHFLRLNDPRKKKMRTNYEPNKENNCCSILLCIVYIHCIHRFKLFHTDIQYSFSTAKLFNYR